MTTETPTRNARNARSSPTLCLLLCLAGAWTGLAPRADSAEALPKKPPLRVVVDPRVELLSIIFRLAGNSEYNRGRVASYTNDVEEHFGGFREHPAVQLAGQLRRTRGVSYDACMSMAVHLSDANALEEKVPFDPHPEGLDGRWPLQGAREFLEKARQFVKDTSFQEFIEKHQPLYETAESRMREVLEKEGHLEWFSEFFGERPQASFTVALGLLNGGACYGPRCRTPDGQEELFCILGVWKTDGQGMPQFDRSMLDTVVHEFCHSYTNAIVDRHEAEFRPAGEKIFPHVASAMKRQAYGHWKTVMYESLVRACEVRYTRKYSGPIAAWMAVNRQKKRQFLWVGELADLLGEYESNRDEYPTLEAFAPRIVAFFDQYAETFAEEHAALEKKLPKVVSITPANGASDVDPDLAMIRVVFDRAMQDGSWSMVGGGPNFPEIAGKPAYDGAKTIWTVPVKLKPDWSYELMLNSDRFTNFQSEDGIPLAPVRVTFKTRKKKPDE
jgi:hypothetical protein